MKTVDRTMELDQVNTRISLVTIDQCRTASLYLYPL